MAANQRFSRSSLKDFSLDTMAKAPQTPQQGPSVEMEGVSHPVLPRSQTSAMKVSWPLISGDRKERHPWKNESSILLQLHHREALSRSREIPKTLPDMEGIIRGRRRSGTRNAIDHFFSPLLPEGILGSWKLTSARNLPQSHTVCPGIWHILQQRQLESSVSSLRLPCLGAICGFKTFLTAVGFPNAVGSLPVPRITVNLKPLHLQDNTYRHPKTYIGIYLVTQENARTMNGKLSQPLESVNRVPSATPSCHASSAGSGVVSGAGASINRRCGTK